MECPTEVNLTIAEKQHSTQPILVALRHALHKQAPHRPNMCGYPM